MLPVSSKRPAKLWRGGGVLQTDQQKNNRGVTVSEEIFEETEKTQNADKHSQKTKKEKDWKPLRKFLLKLLCIGAAGYVILTFVLGVYVVHDNDMFPTVRDGDLVITFKLQDMLYGDVIIYRYGGTTRLGRIVALPGDVIEIDEEGLYMINGSVPYETVYYETKRPENSPVEYPYMVREGELFVLNDMRENMNDSREYGAIRKKDAKGGLVLQLRRRGW